MTTTYKLKEGIQRGEPLRFSSHATRQTRADLGNDLFYHSDAKWADERGYPVINISTDSHGLRKLEISSRLVLMGGNQQLFDEVKL